MARTDVLPGTLDLLIIKTLDTLGAQHSYAIAKRLQQISDDALRLNQGSLYPALLRLEQRGWIRSEWRTSENNRQAKYYSLTRSGRRELAVETAGWERMAGIMARVLEAER
jgi:PadR family transcriptional regulator, regulatory protein PadR